MKQSGLLNSDIDRFVKNALESEDDLNVPDYLVDLTIKKLESRILLKQLVIELSLKAGLVIGSIGVVSGVLLWSGGIKILKSISDVFLANSQLSLVLILAATAIIITDQIIFRYYSIQKDSSGSNR
jgi:hypothetical protein